MATSNPEINFFSCNIGMGNRAAAAASLMENGEDPSYGSVYRHIADGPFTSLARFTQDKVTHSLKGSSAYSNAKVQGFLRSWVAPLLVGVEGYQSLIAKTPKLRPYEQRILISTTELLYLPYLNKLEKKFAPYFTHLALLVADTSPKPTAENMLKTASTMDMPVYALVSTKGASASLVSAGIPTIGIAPPLAFKRSADNQRAPISILKESGTGMDYGTRDYFVNLMRSTQIPHVIINQFGQIQTDAGTSQPTHLTHLYRSLAQQDLAFLATHASEMVLAIANNPPDEPYLAARRGVQETNNLNWVASHFDQLEPTNREAELNISHLRKNDRTLKSLQDSIHHTPLIHALLKALAPNSSYLRSYTIHNIPKPQSTS